MPLQSFIKVIKIEKHLIISNNNMLNIDNIFLLSMVVSINYVHLPRQQ